MDNPEQLLLLPLWYVVFLLSLTCHEAAHALVAHLGGDDTAYALGQVTLNPVPHMQREPMGTMAVPVLTFFLTQPSWMMGWASAPYDPYWEDRHPRRAALMGLAGPVANLALFALGSAVLRAGVEIGIWTVAAESYSFSQLVAPVAEDARALDAVARLASILTFLNLVLFVFNLIPLPPLDGSQVLAGLFGPARRVRDALRASMLGSLGGLVVAWSVFPYVFNPIWRLAEAALFG